jgi:hypothetical protein
MRLFRGPRADTTVLGAASLLALAMGSGTGTGADVERFEVAPPAAVVTDSATDTGLGGVWETADGTVRLDLRPDGTYRSWVEGRWRAASGTYRVADDIVYLRDDAGLRTTVTRFDDALELAGHQLFRVPG